MRFNSSAASTPSSSGVLREGGTTLQGHETRSNLEFGRKPATLLCALAVFILMLTLPVGAGAKAGGKGGPQVQKGGPKVTVMTRNVYLGADLGPALAATTLE